MTTMRRRVARERWAWDVRGWAWERGEMELRVTLSRQRACCYCYCSSQSSCLKFRGDGRW